MASWCWLNPSPRIPCDSGYLKTTEKQKVRFFNPVPFRKLQNKIANYYNKPKKIKISIYPNDNKCMYV